MKKIYEEPSAQLYRLRVQEDLLTLPTVSDNDGFGFDDDGPADARRINGE